MPCGLVVKDRDFHPAGPGSIPRGIICLIIIFRFALYKYDFLFFKFEERLEIFFFWSLEPNFFNKNPSSSFSWYYM